MEKVVDSLEDWETTYHTERGQLFAVAYRKGEEFSKSIEESGPFSSLQRDGRYLLPLNKHVNGIVTNFTQTFEMFEKQRRDLHFRDGDIIVASFPRSGTTWLEQIVLLLLERGDESNLNTATKNVYNPEEPEKRGKLCIELLFHSEKNEEDVGKPWGSHVGQAVIITPEQIESMSSPRVFKTHLHPYILPGFGRFSAPSMDRLPDFKGFGKDLKLIYAIRDPKDVVVSLYKIHLCDMLHVHKMPFTAYVKLFLNGDNLSGGSWSKIVKEYIKLEKMFPKNFMVLTYEYNSRYPKEAMERIVSFLDISLTSEELDRSLKFSSFDQMKEMSKNAAFEHVHSGKVGGWRDIMSKEMVIEFNKLVEDPELGEYGKQYIVPSDEIP